MGQAKMRATEIAELKKLGEKSKVNIDNGYPHIKGYDSLNEMVEAIKENNKEISQRVLLSNLKLSIDITHISGKNQNSFMGEDELRNPNPMDILTLHNEIINGNVSEKHFGSEMVSKIDKLYSTLKSFIDSVAVYDNNIGFALNQEINGAENFYYITKQLSKHFYTDIEKINQHLETLTKLSYGNDYYPHRNSLSAMYVALYIEATLYVGSKGNN